MAKFKEMPRGGRTPGARNRLSNKIIEDIAASWDRNGAAALDVLRIEDNATYCRLCVGTLPKELDLEVADKRVEMREWMGWLTAEVARVATPKRIEAKEPVPALSRPMKPQPGPIHVAFNASEHAAREAVIEKPKLKLE